MSNLYPVLTKFGVLQQAFTKVSNIKFHGHLASGSHADPCGFADGQTDMAELIGAILRLCETFESFVYNLQVSYPKM